MVRISICLALFLQACASHVMRCDAHLQAINAPAEKPALSEKAAAAGTSTP